VHNSIVLFILFIYYYSTEGPEGHSHCGQKHKAKSTCNMQSIKHKSYRVVSCVYTQSGRKDCTALLCCALPASSSSRSSVNAAPKSFAKSHRTFPAAVPAHIISKCRYTVTVYNTVIYSLSWKWIFCWQQGSGFIIFTAAASSSRLLLYPADLGVLCVWLTKLV